MTVPEAPKTAPGPTVGEAAAIKTAAPRRKAAAARLPLVPVLTTAAILVALLELVLFAYVPFVWAVTINAVLIVIALLIWARRRTVKSRRRAAAQRHGGVGAARSAGLPGLGGAPLARRGVRGLVDRVTGRRAGARGSSGSALAGSSPRRGAVGRLLGKVTGGRKPGASPRGSGSLGLSSAPRGRMRASAGKLRGRVARRTPSPGGAASRGGRNGSSGAPRSTGGRGWFSRFRPSGGSRPTGRGGWFSKLRPSSTSPKAAGSKWSPKSLFRKVPRTPKPPTSTNPPAAPAKGPTQTNRPSAPPVPRGGNPMAMKKPARPDPGASPRRPAPPPASTGVPDRVGQSPLMQSSAGPLMRRLAEMNLFQFHREVGLVAESTLAATAETFTAMALAAEAQPNNPAHTEALRSMAAEIRALESRANELVSLALRGNETDYSRAEAPRGGNATTEAKADSREYRNL